MNTKTAVLLFSVFISALSGAAFGQKLYPVQGPLSSQATPPVFHGNVGHPIIHVGLPLSLIKSWTLSNGEIATGKLKPVKISSLDKQDAGGTGSYPPQPNLSFAWDAIYGAGYSTAHLLGNSVWQGISQGNQGTVLQVELTEDGGKGAAVDNDGNVYKVTGP